MKIESDLFNKFVDFASRNIFDAEETPSGEVDLKLGSEVKVMGESLTVIGIHRTASSEGIRVEVTLQP